MSDSDDARQDVSDVTTAASDTADEWVTVPEVVTLTGKAERTVWRWIEAGKVDVDKSQGTRVSLRSLTRVSESPSLKARLSGQPPDTDTSGRDMSASDRQDSGRIASVTAENERLTRELADLRERMAATQAEQRPLLDENARLRNENQWLQRLTETQAGQISKAQDSEAEFRRLLAAAESRYQRLEMRLERTEAELERVKNPPALPEPRRKGFMARLFGR